MNRFTRHIQSHLGHAHQARTFFVALVVWVALVVAGFAGLVAYSYSPGAASHLKLRLAAVTADQNWTLIVGVHPQCPCTTATVLELGNLMRRHQGDMRCQAVVYYPAENAEKWMSTPLVQQLRGMTDVILRGDCDGMELKQLGMTTSGSVRLFDPQGSLRFHGGITPSRGHYGPNGGSEAITAILLGKQDGVVQTPVYGCRIYRSAETVQ